MLHFNLEAFHLLAAETLIIITAIIYVNIYLIMRYYSNFIITACKHTFPEKRNFLCVNCKLLQEFGSIYEVWEKITIVDR